MSVGDEAEGRGEFPEDLSPLNLENDEVFYINRNAHNFTLTLLKNSKYAETVFSNSNLKALEIQDFIDKTYELLKEEIEVL